MTDERREIVDSVLKSGLAEKCVAYQTNKCNNQYLKEELLQELYLWLCTYDIDKLKDAYKKKHMNALITRWISNNFFSKTSPFYKQFKRFDLFSDEITNSELQIPDD